MHDDGLRTLLTALDPKAGDDLRRVLIHDRRTATVSHRSCSAGAIGEAAIGPPIIDMLTMHPDARRPGKTS
jgi:hypothetical protein